MTLEQNYFRLYWSFPTICIQQQRNVYVVMSLKKHPDNNMYIHLIFSLNSQKMYLLKSLKMSSNMIYIAYFILFSIHFNSFNKIYNVYFILFSMQLGRKHWGVGVNKYLSRRKRKHGFYIFNNTDKYHKSIRRDSIINLKDKFGILFIASSCNIQI